MVPGIRLPQHAIPSRSGPLSPEQLAVLLLLTRNLHESIWLSVRLKFSKALLLAESASSSAPGRDWASSGFNFARHVVMVGASGWHVDGSCVLFPCSRMRSAKSEGVGAGVLIRMRAFGLNRSELHIRLRLVEDVTFPRVLAPGLMRPPSASTV
jgi:hypothetical protein